MEIDIKIKKMKASDWKAVAEIYSEGIASGIATFETDTPSYDSWNAAHMSICRLVAIDNKVVLGWAALSPVSSRCVYGGIGEVSIYVGKDNRGKGIGKLLMEALITQSEAAGLWSLQSGIFPENESSIELHKKVSFRYIGKRERIGKLKGVWKDNLLFERRSDTVGI